MDYIWQKFFFVGIGNWRASDRHFKHNSREYKETYISVQAVRKAQDATN